MRRSGARVFVGAATLVCCAALDNGLARTPPMGWNSWNAFGCAVNESLIRETADAVVRRGLLAAGYRYLNLDDCWAAASRDPDGRLAADPGAFPSGMAALGDHIHSRGLLFGIYSSAGNETCAGRAASLGHEVVDVQSFGSWGVDLLKYDNCGGQGLPPRQRFPPMSAALLQSSRRTLFSVCEWGVDAPENWAPALANTWRTSVDIADHWLSVLLNLEMTEPVWASAGPGAWADADLLEVGNGGLSPSEQRAHFSLWVLLKAPLLLSCDVRGMSNETLELVTNPEVLAVNQDALGVPGRRVWSSLGPLWAAWGPFARLFSWGAGVWGSRPVFYVGALTLRGAAALCEAAGPQCTVFSIDNTTAMATLYGPPEDDDVMAPRATTGSAFVKLHPERAAGSYEVWAGPLAGGDVAVVLLNRALKPAPITALFRDIGLPGGSIVAAVRDLWARADRGVYAHAFTTNVPAHGVVMLRLTPRPAASRGEWLAAAVQSACTWFASHM